MLCMIISHRYSDTFEDMFALCSGKKGKNAIIIDDYDKDNNIRFLYSAHVCQIRDS